MISMRMPKHMAKMRDGSHRALGGFTSDIKSEREDIHRKMCKLLTTKGPKLEAVSYGVVKYAAKDLDEIFRVSTMDTLFKQVLDTVAGHKEYYACNMGGYTKRIRKFCVITLDDNRKYLIFQQEMNLGSVLSVINCKTLERFQFTNIDEVEGYFRILDANLRELPLLLNVRGTRLKALVRKRLTCA